MHEGMALVPALADALEQALAAQHAAQAVAGLNAQELHDQRDTIAQLQRDLEAERANGATVRQALRLNDNEKTYATEGIARNRVEMIDALLGTIKECKAVLNLCGFETADLRDGVYALHEFAVEAKQERDAALAKVAVLTEERDAAEGKREMAYRAYSDVLRELDEQTKDHKIVQENAGKVINDQRDHIVELQARLADLDPPWSDEPPTVPGKWWLALRGQEPHLRDVEEDGGLRIATRGFGMYGLPVTDPSLHGARWRPAPKARDPWKGE